MTNIPADWPRRAASEILHAAPHRWHVQRFGEGPDILALHGAGASSHSFHELVDAMPGYRFLVPDLPGQGLTTPGTPGRFGLDAMAEDLLALCADQGWSPSAIIGHSAGGAIALRMAELMDDPPRIIGINAALGPFGGLEGWLFPKLAKLMSASPFIANAVTGFASQPRRVEKLLTGTGSTLDSQGIADYRRLVARSSHVGGTLSMMAAWDLQPLIDRFPTNPARCLLIGAEKDRAVPPSVSKDAAKALRQTDYVEMATYGHLVHEEAAPEVATLIKRFLHPEA